jgi:SAM-dependent methyltransferase
MDLRRRLRPRRKPTASPPQWSFERKLHPGSLASEGHSVTHLLFDRLDSETVAAVDARTAQELDLEALGYEVHDPAVRAQLTLCYGMWFGMPSVSEQTGLRAAQPPEDVHAMGRGPLAAAGGLYEADLVVDALAGAGVGMEGVRSGLDFGCSSGRVVRVLAAAYPDTRWLGCDPNERAISWARANLPGIEFFVNGNQPPLTISDGSLDLAFAISIWSHFEPALGTRWFDEMHRVIRAGGHLVVTTHGSTSVAWYAAEGLRSAEQSGEIRRALWEQGWWYHDEFGRDGDWGVVNPAWGTSFLSPEWLLERLCPRWRVLEFAPGRNASNQDVYVLERA